MSTQPIKATALLMLNGTSLTNGYLSGFWDRRLLGAMYGAGLTRPVRIINVGKGSQTSDYLVSQLSDTVRHRPTHLLTELNSINDASSLYSGGLVGHEANARTYIETLLTNNPQLIITIQTMSPGPSRPNLADYYQKDLDLAVEYGLRSINNYPRWPDPLTAAMTNNGDTLHPNEAATDQYLLPYVVADQVPLLNAWNGGL